MPVTYQYENDKQGVIITAVGAIDGEDFIHNMKELFSDDQATRNYRYGLNDFTQLEKFNISLPQISTLADLHINVSKINPNIIVGFAISKSFIHGLVNVWKVYAEITGWQVNITKTLPEIRDWVDRKPTQS